MKKLLFALAVAGALAPSLSQAQVKLLRHPTYSNGKVAFSYLGDLWIASENGSGESQTGVAPQDAADRTTRTPSDLQ